MTEVKNKPGKMLQTHKIWGGMNMKREEKNNQTNDDDDRQRVSRVAQNKWNQRRKKWVFCWKKYARHIVYGGMREQPKRRDMHENSHTCYALPCHIHTPSIRIFYFSNVQNIYDKIDGQRE